MRRFVLAGLSGLLAAAAGLVTAELLATLVRPESSPLITIGGSVIDATPTPVKEFAVSTFGAKDKPLLLTGILFGLAVAAFVIGVLAARRRRIALVAVSLFGVVGVVAALSRPTSRPFDALPAAVTGVVAAVTLAYLTRQPSPVPAPPTPASNAEGAAATARGAVDRRRLLVVAGGVVAVGASAGVLRYVDSRGAGRSRELVTLPAPAFLRLIERGTSRSLRRLPG